MTLCKDTIENSLFTIADRNGKKAVFNWFRMPNFWEGRAKNKAKTRKKQFPWAQKGKFLQFVSETLEHPLYTFLMTNLLLLSQKLTTKLKKLYF